MKNKNSAVRFGLPVGHRNDPRLRSVTLLLIHALIMFVNNRRVE